MKRLYKVLLVIILLIYLISISTIIWPDIITKIISFLDHINLHSSLSEQMLLRYNELFILGLTQGKAHYLWEMRESAVLLRHSYPAKD